jgi:hypothetical protein
MSKTANEKFLESSQPAARAGLITLSETTLVPYLHLYRFGNTSRPNLHFCGPWWVGFSPFEALKGYAESRGEALSLVARECLAIDWGWSKVDVLVEVVVKQSLSAWSGTPKTQFVRGGGGPGGRRWEPDRRITQLHIPGLGERDPSDSPQMIWEQAFADRRSHFIGVNVRS